MTDLPRLRALLSLRAHLADGAELNSDISRERRVVGDEIVEMVPGMVEELCALRRVRDQEIAACALLTEGSNWIFCSDEYIEIGGEELSSWIQRADALLARRVRRDEIVAIVYCSDVTRGVTEGEP